MRRLLIIPIVHSRSDLGSLDNLANQFKAAAVGVVRAQLAQNAIDGFWSALRDMFAQSDLDLENVLIYQDGLPYVSNVALQIESRIVSDLAQAGSPNHQLVQCLMQQGAALVGTESPDLLIKEYNAARRKLLQGFRATRDDAQTTEQTVGDESHSSESLLEQRDRFIANRIANTLGSDQIGVLFIGLLHDVQRYLPDDIHVEYPAGRPGRPGKRGQVTFSAGS